MKLFKDLVDGRIRFYWSSTRSGAPLSPMMATLQEAEEWWKTFQFSQYEYTERRCSVYDRRSDHDKRRRMAEGKGNGHGRRSTDRPLRVACDLAAAKITLLSHMAQDRAFNSVYPV